MWLAVFMMAALFWWRFSFLSPQTSSECGSAVSTRSSLSDDEDMGWSFSWPPTAWHCFLKGKHTQINTLRKKLVLTLVWQVSLLRFYHLFFCMCHKCEELLLPVIRYSSAFPQRLQCGVAGCWRPGGRLWWWGAIQISEGASFKKFVWPFSVSNEVRYKRLYLAGLF